MDHNGVTARLDLANWQRLGKVPGVARVLDLVYPPRCLACPEPTETPMGLCGACWRDVDFMAGQLCDVCGTRVAVDFTMEDRLVCDACTQDPPGWDRGRAAVAYDGAGKRIVLGLKHGDRLDMIPTLCRWMTGAGAPLLTEGLTVVPVPLHWRRRVARRYNQSAELARAVAARADLTYAPEWLVRKRATPPMKGMRRAQRIENVRGALTVPDAQAQNVKGRAILLVDDVLTTGATLAAASDALRAAGAKQICVLVLARVEIPK